MFYECYRVDLDMAMTAWCESKTNELFHMFSFQFLAICKCRNGNFGGFQASYDFSMSNNAFGSLLFINWILNI